MYTDKSHKLAGRMLVVTVKSRGSGSGKLELETRKEKARRDVHVDV